MATTAESLAKQLGITPQALRRKLRALGLGHAKGVRWTWEDGSRELATLKERIREGAKPKPKAQGKAKPAAKNKKAAVKASKS